jgi:YVTN family beta-propeller protein
VKASPCRNFVRILASCLVIACVDLPTASQSFAYLTNQGDNTVSVISTITNTVISTVPVGHQTPCLAVSAGVPAPTVAVTPNGGYAYVTNCGDNTVSVVNTSTDTIVATVLVGNSPFGVAITPSGAFAYVTNTGDSTVSVIDTANNTVVSTVAVGNGPFGVAITPNGAFAYVVNGGGQSVSVINTATNTVTATISIGQNNGFVAITPNGAFAYVSIFSGLIDVIDTSSNTVVAEVSTGGAGTNLAFVAITPNGSFAYVAASGRNTIYVVNTATNTVATTIPVGNFPVGVAITQNGSLAYVTNQNDNTVSVINIGTNTVVTTVAVGTKPYGMAISPGDDDTQFALLNGSNTFTGNQTVNGAVTATSFAGNGSGLIGVAASSLGCIACVGNTQLAVSYAAGDTQGGSALNALRLGGSAPSAFATLGTNTFTGTQIMPALVSTGPVTIGSGTAITKHLSIAVQVLFPRLMPATCFTLGIQGFVGASDGDTTALGISNSLLARSPTTMFTSWVSGPNVVTVRACNVDPGGRPSPAASGTIRVDLWKH